MKFALVETVLEFLKSEAAIHLINLNNRALDRFTPQSVIDLLFCGESIIHGSCGAECDSVW